MRREALPYSPFDLLAAWLAEAEAAEGIRARAMVVATSTRALGATARNVLLLRCDAHRQQLTFGTSAASLKSRQLAEDPRIEAVFAWGKRQVRVRGMATLDNPLGGATDPSSPSRHATREAFGALPRGAQFSLHVAQQGRALDEEAHAADVAQVKEMVATANALAMPQPRPPESYTAVLIEPATFEFYQGTSNVAELGYIEHDRFLYVKCATRMPEEGSLDTGMYAWEVRRLQA